MCTEVCVCTEAHGCDVWIVVCTGRRAGCTLVHLQDYVVLASQHHQQSEGKEDCAGVLFGVLRFGVGGFCRPAHQATACLSMVGGWLGLGAKHAWWCPAGAAVVCWGTCSC